MIAPLTFTIVTALQGAAIWQIIVIDTYGIQPIITKSHTSTLLLSLHFLFRWFRFGTQSTSIITGPGPPTICTVNLATTVLPWYYWQTTTETQVTKDNTSLAITAQVTKDNTSLAMTAQVTKDNTSLAITAQVTKDNTSLAITAQVTKDNTKIIPHWLSLYRWPKIIPHWLWLHRWPKIIRHWLLLHRWPKIIQRLYGVMADSVYFWVLTFL